MAVTQLLQKGNNSFLKGWEAGGQPVFPKQQGRAKSSAGSLAAGECGAGSGREQPGQPSSSAAPRLQEPVPAAPCSGLPSAAPQAGHSVSRGCWPCTHLGWLGSGELPSLGCSKMPALMFSPEEWNHRELAPFPVLNFTHKCTHC